MAFYKSAPKKFTAWSWSRWVAYDSFMGGCPAKAKYKFLDKLESTRPSPAMDRGDAIHKEAEEYLKGIEKRMSPNIEKFSTEFKRLKKLGAKVEEGWNFRKDWTTTVYNDWDNVWVRIKTDASLLLGKAKDEAEAIDHKTGRFEEEKYVLQMELYAVGTFALFPDVQKVTTRLWFLDHGKETKATYERDQFPRLKKEWERRVKPLLADVSFRAKPSAEACKWCDYKKAQGGPCKF